MGRRSDLINLSGLDFGIETTSALFQHDGTDPSRMDELKMQHIDYDYDYEITLIEHKQNQHIHIIIVQ